MKNRINKPTPTLSSKDLSFSPKIQQAISEAKAKGMDVSVMEVQADSPDSFVKGMATLVEQSAISRQATCIQMLDSMDAQMKLPTGAYIDIALELARRNIKTERETGVKFEKNNPVAVSFLRFAARKIKEEGGLTCGCVRCACGMVFQLEFIDGRPHEEAMRKTAEIVNALRDAESNFSEGKNNNPENN